MADTEAPDGLAQLEKKLYERSYVPPIPKRHDFSRPEDSGGNNWTPPPPAKPSHEESRWVWRLLLGALIFFSSTLIIGGFLLFRGGNVVSNSNIEVIVRGPTAVKSGEETTLQIVVTNRNRIPLESAALVLVYPDSTKLLGPDGAKPAPARVKLDLGSLAPGETATKLVNPIFYGEQNTSQTVKITVEYKVGGSNALFEKSHQYALGINSSPVAIVVNVPEAVSPGDTFTVTMEITSNSQSVLKNLRLVAEYPSDLKIISSNPEFDAAGRAWNLGDLTPGEKRLISLRAQIIGQSAEVKSLLFTIGTAKAGDSVAIDIPYGDHFEAITLKPALLGLQLTVNDSPAEAYHAGGDESLRYKLSWINNTNAPLRDVVLVAKLSGNAFAQESISTNGVYRSSDNTITWTKVTTADLALVRPGEGGTVGFNLKTLPTASGASAGLSQPLIKVVVESSGINASGVGTEVVRSSLEQVVRLGTAADLGAKALYSIGAFTNTGSVPPKVERETTYTVVWNLSNTTNDLKNATVKAVLPGGVKWLGKVSPGSESVTFDTDTQTVTWQVGTLGRGTGLGGSSGREVSFQIGFTPSANQVGERAPILGESRLAGTDSFTGRELSITRPALTTKLLFDPAFANERGVVVK